MELCAEDHKQERSRLVLNLLPPLSSPLSATKKQGGSTNNRGNQLPKMLGVKLFGGARAGAGAIIVRQRGTRVHAGDEVGMVRKGKERDEKRVLCLYHASRHSWIVPRGQGRGERGAAWAQGATVVGSQKQKELKQDKFLPFHRTSFPQGRDHTLFALSPGVVTFGKDRRTGRKTVSIVPAEA